MTKGLFMKLKIVLLVIINLGLISQAQAGMGFYFDDDDTSFSISSGRRHHYAPPPPPSVVVLPPSPGPHYAPPPPPPREFGPGPWDDPRGFAPPPRGPHGHHHRHFR